MDLDLHEALARFNMGRRWSYQLPSALERKFAHETDTERNRQIRVWIIVWFIFSWGTLILDVLTVPTVWRLALALRLFAVTPAAIASFWLLRGTRRRWLMTLGSISLPAISLLSVLTVFAVAGSDDGFHASVILSLGVLWTNVLIPVRFPDTLLFTGVTVVTGETINAVSAHLHHVAVQHYDVTATGLVMAVLSILARFSAEWNSRESFVAGLKLQFRNEQLERSNASLLQMSNTDPLTGLANRRFFDDAMVQAWQAAAAARSWIAVMMIDVDQFKLFNDAAGHLEGDRCLTIVARAIADHVRIGFDLAARFGGEEFIVLLPSTGYDEARDIADRVHTAIGALRVFHPGRIGEGFVSVSIGLAAMNPAASAYQSADLLAAADEALYAAKAAGRNRVVQAKV